MGERPQPKPGAFWSLADVVSAHIELTAVAADHPYVPSRVAAYCLAAGSVTGVAITAF